MGLIGEAVGSIMNFGSSLVNAGAQIGSTVLTNKANKAENEKSRAYNLEMWNLANEYNSPSAQMARLAKAGLNPNLVYGGGGAVTHADSVPAASPTHFNAPDIRLPSLAALIGQILDLKIKDEEYADKKYQTGISKETYRRLHLSNEIDFGSDAPDAAFGKGVFGFSKIGDEPLGTAGQYYRERMLKLAMLQGNNQMINQKVSNENLLGKLRSQEIGMNEYLKDWNMSTHDPLLARFLLKVYKEANAARISNP